MKKFKLFAFALAMFLGVSIANTTALEYSETYSKLFPGGEYTIYSIPIKTADDFQPFFYSTFMMAQREKALPDYALINEGCKEDFSACTFNLNKVEENELGTFDTVFDETHEVKLNYKYNPKIMEQVQVYLEKAKAGAKPLKDEGDVKLYTLTDLNLINFYSALTSPDEMLDSTLAISFLPELKKEFDNSSMHYEFSMRAGSDMPMQSYAFGYFVVSYEDTVYGYANGIGIMRKNVIYIPTETANTKEAYIEAAKKRLKDYLGKDIKIEVASLRSEMEFEGEYDWAELGAAALLGDYYYKVEINGVKYDFVIARDTDKMQKGDYLAKDMNTQVSISTHKNIPLDTLIFIKEITDNKTFQEKLGRTNIYTLDINLKSLSTNKNITKLEDGTFRVAIPIPEALKGRKLVVEYIASDGKIERHDVVIENGIAYFETNHFSTYSLGDDGVLEENPNTLDGISTYLILGSLSLIGIAGISIYLKRKNS